MISLRLFSVSGSVCDRLTLFSVCAEPIVYFGESSYHVDESSRKLKVIVWRSGTDLQHESTVTVRSRSRSGKPSSAQGMTQSQYLENTFVRNVH